MFSRIKFMGAIFVICLVAGGAYGDSYKTLMPVAMGQFSLFDLDDRQSDFEQAINRGDCTEAKDILSEVSYLNIRNFWLSRMYQKGICFEQDYEKAISLLIKTDVKAQLATGIVPDWTSYLSNIHHDRVGLFYEHGLGVEKDIELARRYYQSAIFGVSSYSVKRKAYPFDTDRLIDFEASKIIEEEYSRYLNISENAPESYYKLAQDFDQHPVTKLAAHKLYLMAKKIGHPEAKLLVIKRRLALEMTWEAGYSFKEALHDLHELIEASYEPALDYTITLLRENPLIELRQNPSIESPDDPLAITKKQIVHSLEKYIAGERSSYFNIPLMTPCGNISKFMLDLQDYCAYRILRKR
ncbi:SEL1-like repeat protein [Curvivirga aplysinae]|uniref:SEL1-like repeat protein n=1 Tax=Curvivirga aplysinae TaxID=2529852 RepID=UPI001C3F9D61|nr:SEL1-like repeat protein [Curvivirga aplysinae]